MIKTEDGPWNSDTVSYSYANRLRQAMALAMPGASPWQQTYDFDDYWRLRETISPAGTFTYGYLLRTFLT